MGKIRAAEDALDRDWLLLFAAWLIAAIATLGSLFFSYVMELPPCVLCWYQRICLFPLVLVLGRALFPFDGAVVKYALPLTAAGWLTAVYHNLVYAGVIPESLRPCAQGVSCRQEYAELPGFISIPMLSLLAFTALVGILIALARRKA